MKTRSLNEIICHAARTGGLAVPLAYLEVAPGVICCALVDVARAMRQHKTLKHVSRYMSIELSPPDHTAGGYVHMRARFAASAVPDSASTGTAEEGQDSPSVERGQPALPARPQRGDPATLPDENLPGKVIKKIAEGPPEVLVDGEVIRWAPRGVELRGECPPKPPRQMLEFRKVSKEPVPMLTTKRGLLVRGESGGSQTVYAPGSKIKVSARAERVHLIRQTAPEETGQENGQIKLFDFDSADGD